MQAFIAYSCRCLSGRQYQRLIYPSVDVGQDASMKTAGSWRQDLRSQRQAGSPVMGRIRFQHRLRWLLAACLLTIGTHAASMTRECALRDARVLMRIEARESMGGIQEIFDAMFNLMKARHLCQEGKVREALEVYDGIDLGVTTGERPARRSH
jgi:hypothetical protein